jgi:hypothetical protein
MPGADTRLEPGDVFLLLGPTTAIESLVEGKLPVAEAAAASAAGISTGG